jgi:hypothetical protein
VRVITTEVQQKRVKKDEMGGACNVFGATRRHSVKEKFHLYTPIQIMYIIIKTALHVSDLKGSSSGALYKSHLLIHNEQQHCRPFTIVK